MTNRYYKPYDESSDWFQLEEDALSPYYHPDASNSPSVYYHLIRNKTGGTDTDGDGMPDNWGILYGLNPNINDRNLDKDCDGLTNWQEFLLGTIPNKIDTDGDGMSDGWEIENGWDPLFAETQFELPYYENFTSFSEGSIDEQRRWRIVHEDWLDINSA